VPGRYQRFLIFAAGAIDVDMVVPETSALVVPVSSSAAIAMTNSVTVAAK
jgi:hypothetical protein